MVQISILLNKSKIVEIWTKFFISRAILKAQKRQTTFWKWQDKGNFVIIISRNLLLKLGWQINAANYIKNQDDIQVVLHTVMFRGTPCKLEISKFYTIRFQRYKECKIWVCSKDSISLDYIVLKNLLGYFKMCKMMKRKHLYRVSIFVLNRFNLSRRMSTINFSALWKFRL